MNSLRLTVECYKRGLLSKEAADKVAEVRERILRDAMVRQADEFTKALFGKTAGQSTNLRSRALKGAKDVAWKAAKSRMAQLMALGLAGGTASSVANHLFQSSKNIALNKQIASSFDEMHRIHPDLNEHDRSDVRRNFQVLSSYAPSLAANPTVAGSIVKDFVQHGRVSPQQIQMLASTQASIDRSQERPHLMAHPAIKGSLDVARSSFPPFEKVSP